jgi:hypothetical protein
MSLQESSLISSRLNKYTFLRTALAQERDEMSTPIVRNAVQDERMPDLWTRIYCTAARVIGRLGESAMVL